MGADQAQTLKAIREAEAYPNSSLLSLTLRVSTIAEGRYALSASINARMRLLALMVFQPCFGRRRQESIHARL